MSRAAARDAGQTQIEWCPLDRLDELARFIDAHWKRDHILARDRELLTWQHPAPAGEEGSLSVLIASDGGAILAILGVIEFDLCDRGEGHRGAWLTTWAAPRNPQLPHAGLRLLERVLAADYALVGTLGGNELTQRILGAYGFDVRDEVPRWVRILDARRARAAFGDAGDDPASDPIPAPPSGVVLAPWESAAAEWELAWRERFAPGLSGTCRSAAFVQGRYADHPRFDYEVRVVMRDGRADGLLVYRLERATGADAAVARVVEFLAGRDSAAKAAAALAGLAARGGAVFADFYCTSETVAAPLELAGFRREDASRRLPSRFQPFDPVPRPLTAAFRWRPGMPTGDVYFTRSDCDQDRPN